jgi:hypothetical protein
MLSEILKENFIRKEGESPGYIPIVLCLKSKAWPMENLQIVANIGDVVALSITKLCRPSYKTSAK